MAKRISLPSGKELYYNASNRSDGEVETRSSAKRLCAGSIPAQTSISWASRKYSLNEAFFDDWNPVMAYVLGFWFADGYMRKEKSYRITFSSNDFDILAQIRTVMGSSHPIVRWGEREHAWQLTLFSKQLYTGLVWRGGVRGKSRTLAFPVVPQPFLRDFIRGFFDGDGSVFQVRYISTKNHKPRVELRSNFTSGSHSFLTRLMYELYTEIGIALKTIGSYNDGHSLKLGYGMRDTLVLLRYLYYEGYLIGLQRKAIFLDMY